MRTCTTRRLLWTQRTFVRCHSCSSSWPWPSASRQTTGPEMTTRARYQVCACTGAVRRLGYVMRHDRMVTNGSATKHPHCDRNPVREHRAGSDSSAGMSNSVYGKCVLTPQSAMYLVQIHDRRLTECWSQLGASLRTAQAIGLHRDGSKMGLE